MLAKDFEEVAMADDTSELDEVRKAYREMVAEWIATIRRGEALASVNHELAELDKWEEAHFEEEPIREKVMAAKKQYEAALREKFFGF